VARGNWSVSEMVAAVPTAWKMHGPMKLV